jgi:hypothetical protein
LATKPFEQCPANYHRVVVRRRAGWPSSSVSEFVEPIDEMREARRHHTDLEHNLRSLSSDVEPPEVAARRLSRGQISQQGLVLGAESERRARAGPVMRDRSSKELAELSDPSRKVISAERADLGIHVTSRIPALRERADVTEGLYLAQTRRRTE